MNGFTDIHGTQLREQVVDHAHVFIDCCQQLDRSCKPLGEAVPTVDCKTRLSAVFWDLMETIDFYNQHSSHDAARGMAEGCRAIIGPWLFKSRFFYRSFYKPHGYAGDYQTIELAYDLEDDPCEDPTEPRIVNCLEHVSKQVHSVQSLWERRHWLKQLLAEEYQRKDGKLHILDIACGGARYIKDFLSSTGDLSGVRVTLLDQDAAALAFCRTRSLYPWISNIRTIHTPIAGLAKAIPAAEFDVVISAGLFDYLNNWLAQKLLVHMMALTAPGGIMAITNFHPKDPSRLVKEWLVDWWLTFRTEYEVSNLFSDLYPVQVTRSENQALVLVTTRK